MKNKNEIICLIGRFCLLVEIMFLYYLFAFPYLHAFMQPMLNETAAFSYDSKQFT